MTAITPQELQRDKRSAGERHPLEDHRVHPLLSIGFRPFFLAASLSATLLVPFWLLVLESGWTTPYWQGTALHAHEMLFGFTLAVIAGFLLTAGSNWTKQRIASGFGLAALVALWLLGRLLPLLSAPPLAVLAIDVIFVPTLGFVLGRAMFQSKNRRNYVFVGMLGLLLVANLLMHGAVWARLGASFPGAESLSQGGSVWGQTLALHTITLMMLVVAGRVVPMFTRNATGHAWIKPHRPLEVLGLGSFILAALISPLVHESIAALLWLVAGILALVRMLPWGSWTARPSLLWILHFGTACIGLAFMARGLSYWGVVPESSALHLLTVGAIGGLTLGMMVRVSLGHTGRLLVASKAMTTAFVLLVCCTVVRSLGPWLVAATWSWLVSGALWSIAFGLLVFFGWKIWNQPRVDS